MKKQACANSKVIDGVTVKLIGCRFWLHLHTSRLQGTGQNCGLVSRNRPVSTGFYKGTLVSFLVLDVKKVRFVEVYESLKLAIFVAGFFLSLITLGYE